MRYFFQRYQPFMPTMALLVLVLFCIQYHSISFWIDLTSGLEGIIWSITIELVAVYAWSNTKKAPPKDSRDSESNARFNFIFIGILASAVTIIAPAFKNLEPLANDISMTLKEIELIDKTISSYELEKETANKAVKNAMANSEKKAGWGVHIEDNQEKVQTINQQILALEKNKPSVLVVVMGSIKTVIMSVTLLLFQLSLVVLSRQLGGIRAIEIESESSTAHMFDSSGSLTCQTQKEAPIAQAQDCKQEVVNVASIAVAADNFTPVRRIDSNEEVVTPLNDRQFNSLVSIVGELLEKYRDDHGYTTSKEMAKALKIDEKSLSLIKNHERYLSQKSANPNIRLISKDKLFIVADKIGYSRDQLMELIC